MKNKGLIIGLIVFLSVVVVALTTLFIILIVKKDEFHFNFDFFSNHSKNVLHEVSITNKDIYVSNDAGNIKILESKNDQVTIKVLSDGKKCNLTDTDDLFSIECASKDKKIFFNVKAYDVFIYLPPNYINDLELESNFGDIEAQTNVSNIFIKSDCGDVKLEEAKNVKIDMDLGKVEIDRITDYVYISTDSGDVLINHLTITKDSKISAELGEIEIKNASGMFIEAETDLGDIDINKNDRRALYTLNLVNDCGDIKVN